MMRISDIPQPILDTLRRGTVIPAMPLALNARRQLDSRYQRALTRYYMDSGVGGIAVGVHSTQFAIRNPDVALYEPVLRLVASEINNYRSSKTGEILQIAGVCGDTRQAVAEARFAVSQGYHACLLSLAAQPDASLSELLSHCRAVANVMPVIGFYLQPAVGGRVLPYSFWRGFSELENVLAIKIAPFNRYQTLEVVRAVCDAQREESITLYTGNDDNIIGDLIGEYQIVTDHGIKRVRIKGGLLGHWCVWTHAAVKLLHELQTDLLSGDCDWSVWLRRNNEVTDCNAAFFDAANGFSGCIPGIHEVLRRQGLLPGNWCLDPGEVMSAGQAEEIDRVQRCYPHLNDDQFVAEHLDRWLAQELPR